MTDIYNKTDKFADRLILGTFFALLITACWHYFT